MVDRLARGLPQAVVFDIADDPDDGGPWRGAEPRSHAMPERILAGPDTVRERLADNDHRQGRVRILRADHASAQERNAHRAEVIAADGQFGRESALVFLCLAVDPGVTAHPRAVA